MIDAAQLLPITGEPSVMWTRIEDANKPMRRIFPLWLLFRAVRLKKLTLVSPRKWEDPQEDPAALCMLDGHKFGKPQQSLEHYLAPCWAQCWSLNPGSDTLLRAYSRVTLDPLEQRNIDPRNEGVTVTTTPQRMIQALKAWREFQNKGHFVIGAVSYHSVEEISQAITSFVKSDLGPKHFQTVQGRADSLLWKRVYFRHEAEVRILNIVAGGLDGSPDFIHLPFEPNELFEEVSFDPRLSPFERAERKAELERLGYTGTISEDQSYHKIIRGITMEKDWPDP